MPQTAVDGTTSRRGLTTLIHIGGGALCFPSAVRQGVEHASLVARPAILDDHGAGQRNGPLKAAVGALQDPVVALARFLIYSLCRTPKL